MLLMQQQVSAAFSYLSQYLRELIILLYLLAMFLYCLLSSRRLAGLLMLLQLLLTSIAQASVLAYYKLRAAVVSSICCSLLAIETLTSLVMLWARIVLEFSLGSLNQARQALQYADILTLVKLLKKSLTTIQSNNYKVMQAFL